MYKVDVLDLWSPKECVPLSIGDYAQLHAVSLAYGSNRASESIEIPKVLGSPDTPSAFSQRITPARPPDLLTTVALIFRH